MPASSSCRTRLRQGEGESPTRSASSTLDRRPLSCSAARILRSMVSSFSIGRPCHYWGSLEYRMPIRAREVTPLACHAPTHWRRLRTAAFAAERDVPMPSRPLESDHLPMLEALEKKVLWLSSWMVHHANHIRPKRGGGKVGGHQASSASLATLQPPLYFDVMRPAARVAVNPPATPVFHAIHYLLGNQSPEQLEHVSVRAPFRDRVY